MEFIEDKNRKIFLHVERSLNIILCNTYRKSLESEREYK